MAYSKTKKEISDGVQTPKSIDKRKFKPEDLIPCVSITPGEMFVIGKKSDKLYNFADIDDVVEIEFRDLDFMARTRDSMMMKPRYVVQDKDFIALHPVLDNIYSALNSTQDLKDILNLTPSKMAKTIEMLPVGAKDTLKIIAATMIDEGTLDSMQRIKELDKIFGTEMLLKLTSAE